MAVLHTTRWTPAAATAAVSAVIPTARPRPQSFRTTGIMGKGRRGLLELGCHVYPDGWAGCPLHSLHGTTWLGTARWDEGKPLGCLFLWGRSLDVELFRRWGEEAVSVLLVLS